MNTDFSVTIKENTIFQSSIILHVLAFSKAKYFFFQSGSSEKALK